MFEDEVERARGPKNHREQRSAPRPRLHPETKAPLPAHRPLLEHKRSPLHLEALQLHLKEVQRVEEPLRQDVVDEEVHQDNDRSVRHSPRPLLLDHQ